MEDFSFGNQVPVELRKAASRLQTVNRPRQRNPDWLSEPEQRVLRETGADKYDMLDTGTDRIVFGVGDRVVKLARPQEGPYDGIKANRMAVSQYRSASDAQRRLLSPLLNHADDMTWIVQERATRVRGYDHEMEDGFTDKLRSAGINFDDDLRWNVGYIRSLGHDALIDYGNRI